MVRPSAITLTADETERMYQIEEVMFEGETEEILLKYADGKLTVWMLHRDWMKLGVKDRRTGWHSKLMKDRGFCFRSDKRRTVCEK